jgi:hypothetical protein
MENSISGFRAAQDPPLIAAPDAAAKRLGPVDPVVAAPL